MPKKTRSALKTLFTNGAKPNGDNFADIFDSFFNIQEDGLEKPDGADKPLKISAQGDEENWLDLSSRDGSVNWRMNYKPAGAAPGFNLSYLNNSKFYIESINGNVGIGTINPETKLQVVGRTTTDSLVVNNLNEGVFRNRSTGTQFANTVPVANSSGYLDPNWLGDTFSQTNGPQKVPRANASGYIDPNWLGNTFSQTASASKVPMANSAGKIDINWLPDNSITSAKLTAETVIPVACVMAFAAATAPAGWLECNGQAVSRTTYAALFARTGTQFGIGDGVNTFNLPDLRGEFIRGWDNTRGIDLNRNFGTFQDHQMQTHTHTDSGHAHNATHTHASGIARKAGEHTHNFEAAGRSNTGQVVTAAHLDSIGSGTEIDLTKVISNKTSPPNPSTEHEHSVDIPKITFDTGKASAVIGNNTGNSGAETRPRNVALMYCIKY